MNIQVINKSKHPLPEYKTKSSAGMDIRANLSGMVTLSPLERKLIPTGLFIELPEGYEAQIRPRSGLALNEGLGILNSPGTIDADYRGEIGVIAVNLSNRVITMKTGNGFARWSSTGWSRRNGFRWRRWRIPNVAPEDSDIQVSNEVMWTRWISLILILFASGSIFADRQKKSVETVRELSEEKTSGVRLFLYGGGEVQDSGEFSGGVGMVRQLFEVVAFQSGGQYEVAALLLAAKDYNGALELTREAVAGNPENVWYRILLANVLQEKSMIEEACEVYADIIAKYPDREEFYLLEAGLYASVEKWQKAIDVCDKYEEHYGITEPVSIEKSSFIPNWGM